jgi:hypothetical protein
MHSHTFVYISNVSRYCFFFSFVLLTCACVCVWMRVLALSSARGEFARVFFFASFCASPSPSPPFSFCLLSFSSPRRCCSFVGLHSEEASLKGGGGHTGAGWGCLCTRVFFCLFFWLCSIFSERRCRNNAPLFGEIGERRWRGRRSSCSHGCHPPLCGCSVAGLAVVIYVISSLPAVIAKLLGILYVCADQTCGLQRRLVVHDAFLFFCFSVCSALLNEAEGLHGESVVLRLHPWTTQHSSFWK